LSADNVNDDENMDLFFAPPHDDQCRGKEILPIVALLFKPSCHIVLYII
jgi:hypothetical protein